MSYFRESDSGNACFAQPLSDECHFGSVNLGGGHEAYENPAPSSFGATGFGGAQMAFGGSRSAAGEREPVSNLSIRPGNPFASSRCCCEPQHTRHACALTHTACTHTHTRTHTHSTTSNSQPSITCNHLHLCVYARIIAGPHHQQHASQTASATGSAPAVLHQNLPKK